MVLGFDNKTSYINEDASINEAVDAVKITDYSGCTSYMEAALNCLQECETNWTRFNDHLMQNEVNYLKENGVEMVYEAGDVSKLVSNGVALVNSWLSKILGVLRKFATEIAAKVANMTKMLGLSKKDLTGDAKWPEGKSINDYDYNAAAGKLKDLDFVANSSQGNVFSSLGTATDFNKDAKYGAKLFTGTIKQWTGEEKTSCTVQEIKNHVLGSKLNISGSTKGYSFADVKAVVTGFKEGIATVNADAKDAKSVAASMIKSIKAFEKEVKPSASGDEKNNFAKSVHAALSLVSSINSANQALVTAKLSILVGQLAFNKKMIAVYIGKAKKKDEKPEMQKGIEGKEQKQIAAKESFAFGADFELV